MPKVTILYDTVRSEYLVEETSQAGHDENSGVEAVMEMKASHFKNMKRNEDRYYKDQETLHNMFLQAKQANAEGRVIRER